MGVAHTDATEFALPRSVRQSAVESNPAHVHSHLALARLTSPTHLDSYALLLSAKVPRRHLEFVHHTALDRLTLLLKLADGVEVRGAGALAARLAECGAKQKPEGVEGQGTHEAGRITEELSMSKVDRNENSAWGEHGGLGTGLGAAKLDVRLLVQLGDMLWDRDPEMHGSRDAMGIYSHVLTRDPSHAHALIASACLILHEALSAGARVGVAVGGCGGWGGEGRWASPVNYVGAPSECLVLLLSAVPPPVGLGNDGAMRTYVRARV